ncbi:MAG: type I-U CRISPR-associated protein Csb2 [Kineosporiaceae bacterium]
MPLTITVDLLHGVYEAGDADDRRRPEWPPHPGRLFCALVAGVRGDEERAALRWLEEQPPPLVLASAADAVVTGRRTSYVVTNEITKGGSQTHPARTNGRRERVTAFPPNARVRFVWPTAQPEAAALQALDALARRIPYLGRSSGVALAAAAVSDDSDPAGEVPDAPTAPVVWEPCSLLQSQVQVRVPYPGYLAQLEAQFADGRPAWEVARLRGYRPRPATEQVPATESLAPSVYEDLVVFRFEGLRPDGRLAVRFCEALRSAVLRGAGDAPAVLHGHGVDGRPHVAYLALPDVDGPHSDGHLLGLAVAVPLLDRDQRRGVLGAVLGLRGQSGTVTVPVRGIGDVDLSYRPGLVRPWGADPRRWRRGSRRWVTATPVVLDRYPKHPDGAVAEIRRSCRTVGLPEPVDVTLSVEPLTTGAVRMRPPDLPAQVRGRLYRHVSLTFDRNVAGPVLVGAGRYLGVGLFAPAAQRDAA